MQKKFVRVNSPFMNREFREEICVRTRLKNKYWTRRPAVRKIKQCEPLTNIILTLSKKSCGNKPYKIETTLGSLNDSDVIDRFIESNQNHPSVLRIKK